MDGFLLIDKPRGMTSCDVIRKLNKRFMISRSGRKIGHGGTLDPMATGLLVIAVGHATRLLPYFLESGKRYTAEIALGSQTSTDDAEGEAVSQAPYEHVTPEAILQALQAFKGIIQQIPPAYSAIRVDGARAYKLARRGETVEMKPREVEISHIEMISCGLPQSNRVVVDVACSGGTYIRAIARDLGQMLGTGAHLSALRRTESCHFSLHDAHTLDFMLDQTDIDDWLMTCSQGMSHFPCVCVKESVIQRLFKGQPVQIQTPGDGRFRIQTTPTGSLHAILSRGGGADKFLRFSPLTSDND